MWLATCENTVADFADVSKALVAVAHCHIRAPALHFMFHICIFYYLIYSVHYCPTPCSAAGRIKFAPRAISATMPEVLYRLAMEI